MNCLRNGDRFGSIAPAVLAALMALVLMGLVALRSEPVATNASPSSAGASGTSPSNVTVELSSNQLNSIKVGTVGIYHFAMEKEAVGAISFDEDPAVVQAESALLAAAGTRQVASNELVRARSLYETNGVAQRELEQAASDDQTAEAAFKAARDALRALGKTEAEIDQIVAAGAIHSAPDDHPSIKWMLANVLESDSPFVHEGQSVKVTLMAFPGRTFAGAVARVYGTIDPNLHHLSIRCKLDDPNDELRPGMLGNVVIQISEPVASVAIPPNGVVREGDGTLSAWVTADRQHFAQRIIKTGLREDGQVQILDGLQPDEMVVTDGAIFLDNMVNAVPSD